MWSRHSGHVETMLVKRTDTGFLLLEQAGRQDHREGHDTPGGGDSSRLFSQARRCSGADP